MKSILLFSVALLLTVFIPDCSKAQSIYEDVVYLKNGSIIHGMIIEQVPNESIKIQTKDKNVFVFKMDEIMKITKEEVQSSTPTTAVSPSAPPVKKERKINGYTNITEMTFARSFTHLDNQYDPFGGYTYSHFVDVNNGPCFGIQTVNGYQFNRYFSAGVGIGMKGYSELFLVPLFLDLRATLIDAKVSPFIAGEIGNSFTRFEVWNVSTGYDDKGGFMGTIAAGVKFFPAPQMGLNFSVGFNYQELRIQDDYVYYNNPTYSNKTLNQFTVRAGFTF
jgi:hypothetical protein